MPFPHHRVPFMAKKMPRRAFRSQRVSPDEASRLNEIRRQAMSAFPPDPDRSGPLESGIGKQIRSARESRGLTWYSLAELAGVSDPATIRDIEYGRDVKLSNIEAVAAALGLRLELTEVQ
jgi:ribosome-binding protein aMBF1 (putative translation factor)